MDVTVAQLETYISAAASAVASGNYSVAIVQATAGLALLGAFPEQQKANAQLSWTNARQALTETLNQARRLQREAQSASNGSGGIRRTKIKWARPST